MAPQAGAKAYGFGAWGVTNFNGFAESFWETYTSAASSAAIPSTKLVPGDAFIVVTTAGIWRKSS